MCSMLLRICTVRVFTHDLLGITMYFIMLNTQKRHVQVNCFILWNFVMFILCPQTDSTNSQYVLNSKFLQMNILRFWYFDKIFLHFYKHIHFSPFIRNGFTFHYISNPCPLHSVYYFF